MWRKLAGYSLVSFSSFCFFTIVFHAMAQAQIMPSAFLAPTPTVLFLTPSPTLIPTTQPPTTTPVPTQTLTPIPTNTPVPLPTDTPTPQPTLPTVTDVDSLFSKYSTEYSVDKELLKRIARCESGFNNDAENGGYVGMYQFAEQSWQTVRRTMNMDPHPDLRRNAEEAIKTAAFMISRGQQHAWPNC